MVKSEDVLAPFGGTNFNHLELTRSRLHKHDFAELILVDRGRMKHFVEHIEIEACENSLVFIRPGDIHLNNSMGSSVVLYNIAFTQELLEDVIRFSGLDFENVSEPFRTMRKLSSFEKEQFVAYFEEGARLAISQAKEADIMLRTLILNLCVRFLSSFKPERKIEKFPFPEWLEHSCLEMKKRDNFRKGLPVLKAIASKSQEHLIRSFKKYLGQTPTEYINTLRLDSAATLLSTSELAIYTVADESGFENLSHFYHLFKKRFGMSPKRYRRKMMRSVFPRL